MYTDHNPDLATREGSFGVGYLLYILFVISWFLHLTARIPFLGVMRFDLLLIVLITLSLFFSAKGKPKLGKNATHSLLTILIIYVILTLPFVQWPGSVLHTGIQDYVKAVVFYYFTVLLVTTRGKLRTFIMVFVLAQSFRVFEPLYLHYTGGYWGSMAMMADWEVMDRLSGAPYDVINPNGLAFVVASVVPFYLFLGFTSSIRRLVTAVSIPLLINALILTGSRSGFLGLITALAGFWIKSKRKIVLMAILGLGAFASVTVLTPVQRDRYLSIFDSNTKNAGTAQGRTQGILDTFEVALRKPLFGHGLGTSREANANFGRSDQPAHNLYAEVAEELGFVGLVIFLCLIRSIIKNFLAVSRLLKSRPGQERFLVNLNNAMQVWLLMNMVFSFASYGLSSYEWYLFGGFSVVLKNLADKTVVGSLEGENTPMALTSRLDEIAF
jgi:O-antigen ligase